MSKTVTLKLVNATLMQAPVYDETPRGSNWMAVINIDPALPGGLSRRWMPRGKGEALYQVGQLAPFDPVEFGADRVTYSSGKKIPLRWYGVVTVITDDCIELEVCGTGAAAVMRSKEMRQSPTDRLTSLRKELEALEAKAAKVRAAIADLEQPPEPPLSVQDLDTVLTAFEAPPKKTSRARVRTGV